MKQTITRFAPSPTGYLHVGNARGAIINWLYAKKNNGKFLLRFDDTDLVRTKQEYKDAIRQDLKWLGLEWDAEFTQSSRLEKYEQIKNLLLEKGRLYPCFESQEELEMKRKLQLSSGRPPIYDRSSLKLTKSQIDDYINQGKKPHYRFLINDSEIVWQDKIKDKVNYYGSHLGDPIVIREDSSMTYMLCSVIDDIDYAITDIIRGEDHVTNTAVQIQMFEALGADIPNFGHFSLVKAKDEKISKRSGGFDIKSLRDVEGLEAMAINSFFALIGSSHSVTPFKQLSDLIAEFDLYSLSKSPTTYLPEELLRLNHKLLINLDFEDVRERLLRLNTEIDEQFWFAVRPNLEQFSDVKTLWQVCYSPEIVMGLDQEFLDIAAGLLEEGEITISTWKEWTDKIASVTGKKGKELFLPLRLALTGMDHGPELKNILPLIGRDAIIKRLKHR